MPTTIPEAPAMPIRSDYSTNAAYTAAIAQWFAWMASLPALYNALAGELVAAVGASTVATSTSSVSIGTGSKSFTTQAAKNWGAGASLVIASRATPTVDYMYARITAYSGTALTVTVDTAAGSGTHTDWDICLAPPTGLTQTPLGYLNVPVSSHSVDYTAVLGDASTCLLHPAADANNRTFTIPANASVPYEIGTVLTFANLAANNLTIAITTDTLILAGPGSTGSRTLAQYGEATAHKVTATSWLIAGPGLT